MKIILGADHGGYELKNSIAEWLKTQGHEIKDIGTFSPDSVDYPDYAKIVGEEVVKGIAIAANKVKGVRAVLCHDVVMARLSREHNDTNIITMGGRFIAKDLAYEILNVWLNTGFSGGRHARRIEKISSLEE